MSDSEKLHPINPPLIMTSGRPSTKIQLNQGVAPSMKILKESLMQIWKEFEGVAPLMKILKEFEGVSSW